MLSIWLCFTFTVSPWYLYFDSSVTCGYFFTTLCLGKGGGWKSTGETNNPTFTGYRKWFSEGKMPNIAPAMVSVAILAADGTSRGNTSTFVSVWNVPSWRSWRGFWANGMWQSWGGGSCSTSAGLSVYGFPSSGGWRNTCPAVARWSWKDARAYTVTTSITATPR